MVNVIDGASVDLSLNKINDTLRLFKIYIWKSWNKFPDFFRMGTFIESTLMKL